MNLVLIMIKKWFVLILAPFTLALTLWALYYAYQPHLFWDVEWIYDGFVSDVVLDSPAAQSGLKQSHQILAINNLPPQDMPVMQKVNLGDIVSLKVNTGSKIETLFYKVTETPLAYRIFLIERPLIGLVFWMVSLLIWIFRSPHPVRPYFMIAGQVAAALFALITLRISPYGILLSNVCEALLSGLIIMNYALFPVPLAKRSIIRLKRWSIVLVCSVLSSSLLTVFYFPAFQKAQFYFQELGVNLAFLTGLFLLFNRGKITDLFRQRQRRLVLGGLMMGLLPLVIFYRFPQLILGYPIISFQLIYPFLALIPLSYTYALYQGNLGRSDALLKRTLVYSGIGLIFLLLYSALFFAVYQLLPNNSSAIPAIFALLSVSALYVLAPIRKWLNHKMDILFYGNSYDYRSLVRQTVADWSSSATFFELRSTLQHFLATMRFKEGALYLPDAQKGFTQIPLLANGSSNFTFQPTDAQKDKIWVVQVENGKDFICLPLFHAKHLEGYIVVGNRPLGLPLMDTQDQELLLLLADRSATTLANITLVDELKQKLQAEKEMREALADAQKRLSQSRESERLHLAQELHDGPLQLLYSAKHLIEVGKIDEAQAIILDTGNKIRAVCTSLRPPLLARFGVEVALRDWLSKLKTDVNLQANLMPIHCTEDEALAWFRIAQEAVQNSLKHAQATHIELLLECDAEGILLCITDNGKGFEPMAKSQEGHYGLLGMKERAESIGAHFSISSSQSGTKVQVVLLQNLGE